MAAAGVARADGLAAVTLRGVAGTVGVASSLVAHYEPNMDDLVARTFRSIAGAEIDEVEQLVSDGAPIGRLATLLQAIADPARDDVSVLWADAWSIGRRNEPLAAAARELMDRWHALARAVIDAGVADGSMRTDDPDAVALLLFALVDAANGYALVDYRTRTEREALVIAAVARALDLSPSDLARTN
jgi:AcrR family transcriptional regulator